VSHRTINLAILEDALENYALKTQAQLALVFIVLNTLVMLTVLVSDKKMDNVAGHRHKLLRLV
jgi:hypothetical protein